MTSPDPTGHAHAQSKDTHETTTAGAGASINKIAIRVDANALSIIALMVSVAAITIVISQAVNSPQIVDAKIVAGMKGVEASVSGKIADATAIAHAADTNSRVALDKVEQTQVQLGAKGLVQPSTH